VSPRVEGKAARKQKHRTPEALFSVATGNIGSGDASPHQSAILPLRGCQFKSNSNCHECGKSSKSEQSGIRSGNVSLRAHPLMEAGGNAPPLVVDSVCITASSGRLKSIPPRSLQSTRFLYYPYQEMIRGTKRKAEGKRWP